MKPAAARSNSTMDHLVDRVREIVGNDRRITEKTMFGGLTFLLNGHILVGCKKDGRILLSVGKDNNDEALARPGAVQMIHGGKAMRGFIWVEPDAIEDDDDLREWIRTAEKWVAAMPVEAPKLAKPKATAKPKRAAEPRARSRRA